MVLVQVSATHATLKCLSPGTRPQVQSAALVDSKCAHDLSCGTPKLHKWSIDQVIVITWTVRCLLDAYKRPHIYLGIPLFLSFPSLFRRLIDSITNPPFCRNSIATIAQSFFVPLPLGYLHLFSINLGLYTIFGLAAQKRDITKDYGLFTFRTPWCLLPLPFHHSTIIHYTI